MASVPLDIEATVEGIDPSHPHEVNIVRGQAAVATTVGRVLGVRLIPEHPPACEPAVAAVDDADWVVLGPGSWFTSVLPHLFVPELAAALHATRARRCVTLNLDAQKGETEGFGAATYLEVLAAHAPKLRIDAVLVDPSAVDDEARLAEAAAAVGASLIVRPVRDTDGSARHDASLLAAAYREVFELA
jgi:uncharacterized cofD-like protein